MNEEIDLEFLRYYFLALGIKDENPPGTICQLCNSDNVDIWQGRFWCNNCNDTGTITIIVKRDNGN